MSQHSLVVNATHVLGTLIVTSPFPVFGGIPHFSEWPEAMICFNICLASFPCQAMVKTLEKCEKDFNSIVDANHLYVPSTSSISSNPKHLLWRVRMERWQLTETTDNAVQLHCYLQLMSKCCAKAQDTVRTAAHHPERPVVDISGVTVSQLHFSFTVKAVSHRMPVWGGCCIRRTSSTNWSSSRSASHVRSLNFRAMNCTSWILTTCS